MALWDGKKLFDRVEERLTQRKKGYVKFNKARDSITDYFRPDLGSDTTEDGDGSFFGDNIYEGTAAWSIGVMSSGFQGGLVSEQADWLTYAAEQSELEESDPLDMWLQDIKKHISNAYQQSNFYKVLPPFVKDGISIGSPIMFIEEDIPSGTTKFLPQHYKTAYLFYDRFNETEGVIIEDDRWTVKKLADKFAKTKAQQEKKLSKSVNDSIREGKYYAELTVIRAVFKSDDPIWDGLEGFKKPADRKWISVYFEKKTEEENKNSPLAIEGYFAQPFVVWDYDKKPEESMSRTPAFDAIHDVISHMETHKQQLENWELKNRPPRAVLDDHRNIIDFGPEGLNFIAKEDWPNIPEAIDVVGDIRISREELEFSAERIKRWFHTELFFKFTDLTSTLRQQPTATQIIKIAAEIATQVNPGVSTFTGFLRSVDNRMIDIEKRKGKGPFRPEKLAEINDIVIGILGPTATMFSVVPVFIGTLARAQKVKQELDPILEGLGIASGMIGTNPELIHAIRWHDSLGDVFKAVNYPLKNFVPKEEYEEIIKAEREAKAQQQQQLMAIEMAKASKDVSGPVDETSILAGAAG